MIQKMGYSSTYSELSLGLISGIENIDAGGKKLLELLAPEYAVEPLKLC